MDEIETVTEAVAEIIEETEEQKTAARELAAQIVDASLEGERGRQIETLREEINECRSTLDQLPTMLASQFSQTLELAMQTLRTEMAERIASSAVVVVPAASPPVIPDPTLSIPPLSEIQPGQTPAPTPEPPPENLPAAPEPKKKRHRFL